MGGSGGDELLTPCFTAVLQQLNSSSGSDSCNSTGSTQLVMLRVIMNVPAIYVPLLYS